MLAAVHCYCMDTDPTTVSTTAIASIVRKEAELDYKEQLKDKRHYLSDEVVLELLEQG